MSKYCPKDIPILGIAETLITDLLQPSPHVNVYALDGAPYLKPDIKGHKVTKAGRGNGSFIAAPNPVANLNTILPIGSKWFMVWQAKEQAFRGYRFDEVTTEG